MRRSRTAAGVALLLAVALSGASCAWTSPPLESAALAVAETSTVVAADGSVVTRLHGEQDREVVPLSSIPRALVDAVVAIEDERFWEHGGVDGRAVLRAAYANASEGRVAQGGSTITQQYVKNQLLSRERAVGRKVHEASLAYQLERELSKERILELYLNTIYFGNGAYGVQAAAQEYFAARVEQLDLAQAALLAGLVRSPATADPFARPETAIGRRNVVLDRMRDLDLIDEAEATVAAAAPLHLRDRASDARYPAPHFVERVKRFILDDPQFGATPEARRQLLFAGGLRIHTTLDLNRQAAAEAALAKVLSEPGRDPEAALVSIEPATGRVEALVGGRRFFDAGPQGKFDLATQGQRPAGSAFKPFVLATAMAQRIPLSRVYDAPVRLTLPLRSNQVWSVENYEGGGGGRLDLIDATVQSVNTVYAQLIMDVGPAAAIDTAKRLGITAPLQPYPSAVLGTNDVSPLDMASAYATLANRGVQVPPVFVTKVVDRDGTVLFEHKHREHKAVATDVADATVAVLRQVVDRGTGVKAAIGRPVAGKTGTGQEWRDAWFVGFTPELATAVWVGFPEQQRSMVPPATRIRVTGGSWPAQIWQLYSAAALAQQPVSLFPPAPLALLEGNGTGEPRPVPAVIGFPRERAEVALVEAGFRVTRRAVADDEYPPGITVAQHPAPGQLAPGGSVVIIDVADDTPMATVPSVIGLDAPAARAALREAGLEARISIAAPSAASSQGPGRAWKQDPAAGQRVAQGRTVTVLVAPG